MYKLKFTFHPRPPPPRPTAYLCYVLINPWSCPWCCSNRWTCLSEEVPRSFICLCYYMLSCVKLTSCMYVSRAPIEWTERHDVILAREILVLEPFRYKGKFGQGESLVYYCTLISNLELQFKISQRSVRERFALIH